MNLNLLKFISLLIVLNILLSLSWLLHGNLIINFDLSRDLMIWYDIWEKRHLTLIGGHSGTIPGVFHGPLWYYVNLPAFVIGNGNPLALGWFWVLLSVITLFIIYFVAFKLFDKKVALFSILIFSANSIANSTDSSKYFYNPYGAVMLFPLFFYFFYNYLQKQSPKILILSLFILGLIIQFQMAFGVPILLLTIFYLVFFTFKNRLLKHLLGLLILLIPLSSYILFELRHNFIQLQTILKYITSNHPSQINSLFEFISSRFYSFIMDNFTMLIPASLPVQLFFSILFLTAFSQILSKGKTNRYWELFFTFGYYYFGYFLITFFFWGKIVNYYWPFLPLVVIFFCALLNYFPKKISAIILTLLILLNFTDGFIKVFSYNPNTSSHSFDSWDYNYQMARTIFEDADQDFGYYIFTPDLFGYSQRYAMEYLKHHYPKKSASPFVKKGLTYLIMVNPPKSRPDLNTDLWKISDVKITQPPVKTFSFKDYKIEKFYLLEDQIKTPSNPTLLLLNNLYFR